MNLQREANIMDQQRLIATCLDRERDAQNWRYHYDMQAEREIPTHTCANVSSAKAQAMHWEGKAQAWHDAALLLGWTPGKPAEGTDAH